MRKDTEGPEDLVSGGAALPTRYGDFVCRVLRTQPDGAEAIVLTKGIARRSGDGCGRAIDDTVTVRVHSECRTGEAFGSLRCECGAQLEEALGVLGREKRGVLVYLLQEGRGIGLVAKLLAYQLQDRGFDTVEANHELGFAPDLRDYRAAAQILRFLGVRRVALLTNNPAKVRALAAGGLEVTARVALEIAPNAVNRAYLRTKREKLGHILESPDL